MKVVGIVRQSKGHEDSLSPAQQRERLDETCKRDGYDLIVTHEEIDVSGFKTPFDKRVGLRAAVEAVEAGDADIVMVAYFDRLFRSLRVQGEVVERVEAAGGRVVALDFGDVSGKTAASWISGTIVGAVAEYQARSIRERSGAAQKLAVARGVCPFPNIPPGYVRNRHGGLSPDTEDRVEAVRRAFVLRAEGATIKDVRSRLRDEGIERSYHGVQSMLGSRIYLGEIHFGKLHNVEAHEAIIDRGTWDAVQRIRTTRGTRPKSNRLLARLGVLRCGNCGGLMSVGMQTQNGRRYPFYRCSPIGDCDTRVTIGAQIVERFVLDQVKATLGGLQGRASAEAESREADARAERSQAKLDSAIRAFREIRDEPVAIEELRELTRIRDADRDHADHLSRLSVAETVDIDDLDNLRLETRRGLIRETIEAVYVGSGKGVGRLSAKTLI